MKRSPGRPARSMKIRIRWDNIAWASATALLMAALGCWAIALLP